MTLPELLERALSEAAHGADPREEAPPAALLWTDPGREFEPLVPDLLARLPRLFVFGPWEGGTAPRRGPAIWLRCRVEDPGSPTVLYLPGVRRDQLRAVEDQPWALAPLSELRYRGAFFGRPDGADWTRASLLLARDPVGAVLQALDDPGGTRIRWAGEDREALFFLCRDRFGFDPEGERSDVAAARLLARHEGRWAEAWERFVGAPERFAGVVRLLERSEPRDRETGYVESSWPAANWRHEEVLRSDLASLAALPATQARGLVAGLTAVHRPRVDWVWARLGQSPLACALPHLSRLARASGRPLAGATAEELAAAYARSGGAADGAALEALAAVPLPAESADAALVGGIVAKLYGEWLDRAARQLRAAARGALPASGPLEPPAPGECVLFVPGLRVDLAQRLGKDLAGAGLSVETSWRWAGPRGPASVAACLAGGPDRGTGEAAEAVEVHRLLVEAGIQVLLDEELGGPKGRAWAEFPFLQTRPDDVRAAALRSREAIASLADRILGLLAAGWRHVRVVTDRGWVAYPAGCDLPGDGTTPAEAVVPVVRCQALDIGKSFEISQ